MPHEHRQLPCCRYCGYLFALFGLHSLEEGTQWARCSLNRPYGLDQHGSRLAATLLGNAAMEGGMIPGLIHARVQAEVAHELFGRREASDIPDRRQDACSHDRVHATDGHEAADVGLSDSFCRKAAIDHREFLGEAIVLDQVAIDQAHFLHRKWRLFQPFAASQRKKLALVRRDQVCVQDRLNAVLESCELPHQLGPLCDHAALALRLSISDPDLRQETTCVQFRQDTCIDLVGLHPGMRDRANLQRVCHDDSSDERREEPHQDSSITGFLQHDLIFALQGPRKCQHSVAFHPNAPSVTDGSSLIYCDLPKITVNVKCHDLHGPTSSSADENLGSSGSHDNYGFALAAQPGESRGRPDNNASSQLIVYCGLPAIHAPDAPCPVSGGYRIISPQARAYGTSMPDNNAAERAIRALVLGRRNYLFAGSDAGGETAARLYSLIGTCRLNGIDPHAYLHYVLGHIAEHPINRLEELLPWQVAHRLTQPLTRAA